MGEVKQCVRTFKKSASKLSSKTLIAYLHSIDWRVIYLDTPKGQDLLHQWRLIDYAIGKAAFAYAESGAKAVFVQRQLPEKEMQYALLHEIGHILLGHNLTCLSKDDEAEANAFAHQCLNARNQKVYRRRVLIIAAATAFIVLIIGGLTNPKYEQQLNLQTTNEQMVVITPSGKKYHKATCYYVANKTNTLEMSIVDAEQMGRTPCRVCMPQ